MTFTPTPVQNAKWHLAQNIHVCTHKYDNQIYAFEIKQDGVCLGMVIPISRDHMYEIRNMLDNRESLNGLHCNDEYGTIITYGKSRYA